MNDMVMQETIPSAQVAKSDSWTVDRVAALFELPFSDLMYQAQTVHRENFDPNAVQLSTLLSIKTGGCSEDCSYCPQSARHEGSVESEDWRGPKQRDLDPVIEMVKAVKALGLETCATLGMLRDGQAEQLAEAGLDYYNHNLDTAPEFYGEIITTRTYQDRLDTLGKVRQAGIHVCCGGIVGLGESRAQRAGLIAQLANLDPAPESVPINMLVQVEGTPAHGNEALDQLEFVRTIAIARITMPKSFVRLSAGREEMSEAIQTLCFLGGANSIFYGEKLLTTSNPGEDKDRALMDKLGMHPL